MTCTNKYKRCCYLPFSLSLVYNELRNVFVCIATHFLAIFIACKFAFTANLHWLTSEDKSMFRNLVVFFIMKFSTFLWQHCRVCKQRRGFSNKGPQSILYRSAAGLRNTFFSKNPTHLFFGLFKKNVFFKERRIWSFFKENVKTPFWIVFITSCNITIFGITR